MAEIINLRQARKARDRAVAEKKAAANRAHFGRTKAEKKSAKTDILRQQQLLEGVRRDDRPADEKE